MRRLSFLSLVLAVAGCSSADEAPSPASGSPAASVGETASDAQSSDGDGSVCHGGSCRFLIRPLAPLSTSRVTTHRPTLRWALPDKGKGVRVELCLDRACDHILQSLSVTCDHVKLDQPLPSGVVYWRLRPLHGHPKLVSATWEMFVGPETPADTAFGSTLDVNGDGYADAAVSARQPTRVLVFLGGPSGLSTTPAVTLDMAEVSDGAGVANGGDIDGDGFADLLVLSGDQLRVFPGGISGPSTSPSSSVPLVGGVAQVGDFDGDGYGDVVMADHPNERALIYLGGPSGLSATPGAVLLGPHPEAQMGFGASVDGAGDVNGDGLGDVVVGASGRPAGEAAAFVFLGGASDSPSAALVPPEVSPYLFGSSTAGVGDVDGDGLGDVAISEQGPQAPPPAPGGRVFVYLSRGGAFADPPATLFPPDDNESSFALRADGVGDLDGDGFDEVAVSGGRPTGEAGIRGFLYLYRGSSQGPLSSPWASLSDGWPGGHFGESFASPGDVNGDGLADLLMSAPASPTSLGGAWPGAGRVYLYQGDEAAPQLSSELRGEDYGVSSFGASVD